MSLCSFLFLFVEWVCWVCMCVYVYVIFMCTCVWEPTRVCPCSHRCLPLPLSFFPLLQSLSLNQNLIIAANAAGQQVPVCRYGVTGMHMLSFYVHAGDMAPGPLTCMANTLTHWAISSSCLYRTNSCWVLKKQLTETPFWAVLGLPEALLADFITESFPLEVFWYIPCACPDLTHMANPFISPVGHTSNTPESLTSSQYWDLGWTLHQTIGTTIPPPPHDHHSLAFFYWYNAFLIHFYV